MEPHENMTCILPESVVVRLWENLDGSDVSRDILHNEENEPEPQVGIHVIDDVTYLNVLVKDAGGIPLDLHRSSAVTSIK
ncbi:17987_t:CDS:2 [Entrophospora sp. SA101]|nr:17987_t:CDS:2 [Entrophospora sp. SA101]